MKHRGNQSKNTSPESKPAQAVYRDNSPQDRTGSEAQWQKKDTTSNSHLDMVLGNRDMVTLPEVENHSVILQQTFHKLQNVQEWQNKTKDGDSNIADYGNKRH